MTRLRITHHAVGLLVVLVSQLASAPAAAGPAVGVVVAGEPTLQERVRGQVEGWIQKHGYAITTSPLSAEGFNTLLNCFVIEDPACARGVFEHQSRADQLVYVRVDLAPDSSRGRSVALAGYWLLKGRDAVADRKACDPCTNADLDGSIAQMMTALVDASGIKMARVRIREPAGLTALLDGANVGLTPVELDVKPGSHTIALANDGAEVGKTTVDVAAGDVVTVPIRVTARDQRPSMIVPQVLIASGLAAIAAGAIYIHYGMMNGPDEYIVYPDAMKEGVIIAGAGTAALITGLVWWWRAPSAKTGPVAAVSSGDIVVGWGGRF